MRRVFYLQGPSELLNPTLDKELIAAAYADDAESARSEWGGEFRSDVSQWLADELIDVALETGRLPRGRSSGPVGFVDVSGGRHDASVLAIAHAEDLGGANKVPPVIRLDVLHAVPAPHEPHSVVERFAKILKDHKLSTVTGDRYGAGFVEDAFKKAGIRYEASELDKSGIYNEVLSLFAERRVEIIDDKRLVTELRLLERKPRAGGRGDSVDHPPRGHDDSANACCGALWLASKGGRGASFFACDLKALNKLARALQ
jgi:hypothetical protein